jgi:hypothetical protein
MESAVPALLTLAVASLCLASDLPPGPAAYCVPLDRVARLASSRSGTSDTALDFLEKIALGRADNVSAEEAASVGFEQNQLKGRAVSSLEVRQCAFRKIGETGLPEAVAFLQSLAPADVGNDASNLVWATSRLALAEGTLRRTQDSQRQIDFLEETARELSGASGWAVDQLCDRGALGSLPVIEQVLKKGYSGQRAEEEIAFCDARIQVLFGKPDRAKALGSVLNLQTSPGNARLTRWAIQQLYLMHSPAADAELLRFSREIDSVPDNSPFRQGVAQFRSLIVFGAPQAGDPKPQ